MSLGKSERKGEREEIGERERRREGVRECGIAGERLREGGKGIENDY